VLARDRDRGASPWASPEGEGERRHARVRLDLGVLSVAGVRRRGAERLRTRRGSQLRSWIGVRGPVRGSGGGETGCLLLELGRLGVGGLSEDQRHRLDRQVAALDQPLVVLF
jgi:hypothetical protein